MIRGYAKADAVITVKARSGISYRMAILLMRRSARLINVIKKLYTYFLKLYCYYYYYYYYAVIIHSIECARATVAAMAPPEFCTRKHERSSVTIEGLWRPGHIDVFSPLPPLPLLTGVRLHPGKFLKLRMQVKWILPHFQWKKSTHTNQSFCPETLVSSRRLNDDCSFNETSQIGNKHSVQKIWIGTLWASKQMNCLIELSHWSTAWLLKILIINSYSKPRPNAYLWACDTIDS